MDGNNINNAAIDVACTVEILSAIVGQIKENTGLQTDWLAISTEIGRDMKPKTKRFATLIKELAAEHETFMVDEIFDKAYRILLEILIDVEVDYEIMVNQIMNLREVVESSAQEADAAVESGAMTPEMSVAIKKVATTILSEVEDVLRGGFKNKYLNTFATWGVEHRTAVGVVNALTAA